MEYIGVQEAAGNWDISERRVRMLCREGKIYGAKKDKNGWQIPNTAQKPEDGRIHRDGGTGNLPKRPLPIGVSDFKETVTKYYYIDKTQMIRDFLDTIPKVSLFTRPRRFGKTLNMDMLRVFFEKTEEDTSIFFLDKKIWTCGQRYRQYQGKYPVIFMTFKDVKFESWEETLEKIRTLLRMEFGRHGELAESDRCSQFEKEYYKQVVSGSVSAVELTQAFSVLSSMLHAHHGVAPILIIDEYDTPIQQGYMCDYYDVAILFMRNLFSGGLKDNPHLSYGFLTGILRVAKESIFSGMNNLKENSILDERYSEYFGFTKEEIRDMLAYYGKPEKFEEICEWYDGYVFGNTEIFNPWSVINYVDSGCFPKAFWQSTGSNDIIREVVANATPEMKENLQRLMGGESISTYVDTSVIYPEVKNNPSSITSFLLVAGYLKMIVKENTHDGNAICVVAIPNKEVFLVYEKEILSAMSDIIPQSSAIAIQQAIIQQDIPELQRQLELFLRQTISVFDTANESFYQGLMLGIYAIMNHLYQVTSNREAGDGRYDIQMQPYNRDLPGILIELKVLREKNVQQEKIQGKLEKLSKEALRQIDRKQYGYGMKDTGVTQIMKIGIAFYKKQVELVYRMDSE